MSFQIGFSVKKIDTIMAMKRLVECVNAAHVTYMITEYEETDRILVFLHTPPSKFTFNVFLYSIEILEKNIEY